MGIRTVVLLNESDGHFFTGYEPGAALRQAAVFELDGTLIAPDGVGTPTRALEMVFEQLNIDAPTAEWAQQYRADRNRSLSKGDVVLLGEVAYAVAGEGWTAVTLAAKQISR